jgi:hypothetical protein
LNKTIIVADGVHGDIEDFNSFDEAKDWIIDNFIYKDEGIHPNIESVKIYKQMFTTDVVEVEGGYKVVFNKIESVSNEKLTEEECCEWHYFLDPAENEYCFEPQCENGKENPFEFTSGFPKNFKFCHCCGKPIKIIKPEIEED